MTHNLIMRKGYTGSPHSKLCFGKFLDHPILFSNECEIYIKLFFS